MKDDGVIDERYKVGRWLSKDPIGIAGGLNLYAFCRNNPVNYIDPFGLCDILNDMMPGTAEWYEALGYRQNVSVGDGGLGTMGGNVPAVSRLYFPNIGSDAEPDTEPDAGPAAGAGAEGASPRTGGFPFPTY